MDWSNALRFLLARMKEPSSYIGIGILVGALHNAALSATAPSLFLVLQGLAGIGAFLWPEHVRPGEIKSPALVALVAGLIIGLLLCANGASAQTLRPHAGPKQGSIAAFNAMITADMLADVNAAKALADAQKDSVAAACWGELSAELSAQQAAQQSANVPKVALAFTFQKLRGFVVATQSSSPLSIACAPLSSQVKMDVLGLINLVVSGTFSAVKIAPLFGPLIGLP